MKPGEYVEELRIRYITTHVLSGCKLAFSDTVGCLLPVQVVQSAILGRSSGFVQVNTVIQWNGTKPSYLYAITYATTRERVRKMNKKHDVNSNFTLLDYIFPQSIFLFTTYIFQSIYILLNTYFSFCKCFCHDIQYTSIYSQLPPLCSFEQKRT